jgi:hypothetical protein
LCTGEQGVCIAGSENCTNSCQCKSGYEYTTISSGYSYCLQNINCVFGTTLNLDSVIGHNDTCPGNDIAPFDTATLTYDQKANLTNGGGCYDVFFYGPPGDVTVEGATILPPPGVTLDTNVPACNDTERAALTEKTYYIKSTNSGSLTSSAYLTSKVACQNHGSGNCTGISTLWGSIDTGPEGCVAYIGEGDINFTPLAGYSYKGAIAGSSIYLTISPAMTTCTGTPDYNNHATVCKNTFGQSNSGTHYCRASGGTFGSVSKNTACYTVEKNTYTAVKCVYPDESTTYKTVNKICGAAGYKKREIICAYVATAD